MQRKISKWTDKIIGYFFANSHVKRKEFYAYRDECFEKYLDLVRKTNRLHTRIEIIEREKT
jgi:hypothetical protein